MVTGGLPPGLAVEGVQGLVDFPEFAAAQQLRNVLQLSLPGDPSPDLPGFVDGAADGIFQRQPGEPCGFHVDQSRGEVADLQGLAPTLALADVRIVFGKIFLAFWHSLEGYSQ